ncbi:hypothetical protein QFZ75_004912 [Streptomyces sp. V3I8]|uniref:hypothetical protein n=1 Tax=Streptomyces sp. V3I8 TaxID=3042279 RepID=UPI0027889A75|nr:hypothetical protein [Streptomyces sp. V3I8]MDQ1038496.1 hypothetical protein [Streptomyces sp. V3I8]
MRGAQSFAGVLCALLVAVAAALSGCGRSSGGDGGGARESTAAPAPTRTFGYGVVFLGIDECSSFGRESFTEVPCTGERAAARVVARHDGGADEGPPCPATTDFVLHISEQKPPAGEDGGGTVPRGYACMRGLQAPHPGDPGGGGGPRTIVGDCVHDVGTGQVRETTCDRNGGGDGRTPGYRVTSAVERRSDCPASTRLYVRLGGPKPVGCARPS